MVNVPALSSYLKARVCHDRFISSMVDRFVDMKQIRLLFILVPLFLSLSAIFFASCSDRPPIPEKDFVDIYVQLELFDVQYATQPSVHREKADSLLRAFNAGDSLVNSTLSWYSRSPERWHQFFTEVQKKMNGLKPAFVQKSR